MGILTENDLKLGKTILKSKKFIRNIQKIFSRSDFDLKKELFKIRIGKMTKKVKNN